MWGCERVSAIDWYTIARESPDHPGHLAEDECLILHAIVCAQRGPTIRGGGERARSLSTQLSVRRETRGHFPTHEPGSIPDSKTQKAEPRS